MNRKFYNTLFYSSSILTVSLCFVLLFFLFGVIFKNGIAAVNIDFVTNSARNFGAEGGVFYQITGSLLLVITAGLISFPLGLGIAIYKSEYLKNESWQRISTTIIYGLNGIPSVLFGIFGLIFFVNLLDTGISWFIGSIILAFMILPTIILASYQSINSIPETYRESARGLGMNKWQIITKVLIPQGFSGAITGLLIGLARAIGETAPIMFIATAFSGVEFPTSIIEPVSTLPTHILALTQQATNPEALQNAWGASFILLLIVMILSSSALIIRLKYKSKVQR